MFVTRGLGYPSSTLVTRGLGAADLLDLFGGTVTGSGVSTEIIEATLDQLAALDSALEEVYALRGTDLATDLVGFTYVSAMMVGVPSSFAPVSATLSEVALDPETSMSALGADTTSTTMSGSATSSPVMSPIVDGSEDMMGSTDEETGVN